MNPIIFNCVLLYLLVILLSLFQTRFKLITDSPIIFILVLIFLPLFVYLKAVSKGTVDTWTELTGLEIFAYTVVWSLVSAKYLTPRINEGYILAYTLFHWYLLTETIFTLGWNTLLNIITAVSALPTLLVLIASLQHRILNIREKTVIYYWFLFTVIFTYIDQVAMDIVTPITTLYTIDLHAVLVVAFSAIQLYFISTMLSLLFIGIPLIHMDNNSTWKQGMNEWREVRKQKLDNYIEYQIKPLHVVLILLVSGILFYCDQKFQWRSYLIAFYTVGFPLIFFYLKWTPRAHSSD